MAELVDFKADEQAAKQHRHDHPAHDLANLPPVHAEHSESAGKAACEQDEGFRAKAWNIEQIFAGGSPIGMVAQNDIGSKQCAEQQTIRDEKKPEPECEYRRLIGMLFVMRLPMR